MLSCEESILMFLFKLQIVTALSSFLTSQSTKVGYISDQSQYYKAPVKNVIQCQRLCSYQPLCKAFNYNSRSRSCELTLGRDTKAGDEVFVTSKPSKPAEVVSTKCSDMEVFVRKTKPPHMCFQLLDIDCGSPPNVALASYTLSSGKFQSTVAYTCHEGHVQTGGNNSTTCLFNGQWTNVTLKCMEIDCGHPPVLVELDVMVTSTSYNATATYTCREGYNNLGGPGISRCTGDSTWSTVGLNCTVIDCGFPPHQHGAVVDYTNTTFGAEANTFCTEGYSSQGNGTSWCLSNGTWSQTDLVCTVVDCGFPPHQDGSVVDYSNTTFGAVANTFCIEGYSSQGNGTSWCLSNGTWSQTDLVCAEIDCGNPPAWVERVVTVTSTTYNSTATYACREGYDDYGGSRISTCTDNYTWSAIDLNCTIVDCGFPPHQDGYVVDYTNTTFGAEASTFCIEGYSSLGNGASRCLSNGTWSQTDLVCAEIDCGTPPTWVERVVTVTTTSYNSTATYACREGHDDYGGSRISTCTDNSTWSAIDLNCTIVDCGFPPYQDGAMVHYISTTFNAEATYLCVKGYSSSGNGTTTCLSNGTWSQTDLVCTASSHTTWQQVATTTASTTPNGQRAELNNRISANCKPNVRVKTDFKNWTRVTDLHSNGVKSGVRVWGQSVRGLAKSSWDSFETSPQREFELFVSDAQSTHMSVDDSGTAMKSTYDGNFIWLVKDDQCMSTSHGSDLVSVLTSLFKGEVGSNFDTYYMDGSNSSVYGQVSGHVAQSSLPTFQASPYWYIDKKGTLGTSHVIRWKFAGAFVSRTVGSSTMAWCPDTCWHQVLDTRTSPTNKDKQVRHLTNAVLFGHNIMLKVDNVVAKAREIIVHDGHVTAGVKEFWLPANKDAFSAGSLQEWLMASTTGRVVQCTHVPESATVEDITDTDSASVWFLDSREWEKALTIDGTGAVLSGSLSTLLNKVNEGRSARVGVHHTSGIYKALEVDTVDVSSTGQIAVNIIHNAELVSESGNFSFSDTCRVVSSIITTEGSYKMYKYNIGSVGHHSTVNDVAKIDWFIEM